MLSIAYCQTSGGRSGHRLKDLFSSVTLAEALGARAVFHPSWRGQGILPIERVQNLLAPPENCYVDEFVISSEKDYWAGIDRDEFCALRQTVAPLVRSDQHHLVVVRGVYRLHLAQLHSWEQEGLVPEGAYDNSMGLLRSMYWKKEPSLNADQNSIWRIAIHVRRGDVANPKHRQYSLMGPGGVWSAGFYIRLADELRREFPGALIELFSETRNCDDLHEVKGVALRLGTASSLARDFRDMLTADMFIPANSSLSFWGAHLAAGRVRIYQAEHINHIRYARFPRRFEVVT